MEHILCIVLVICVGLTLTTADFRNDALILHNNYRAKYNTGPLTLNKALNNYAQKWAQEMASTNSMSHSNGKFGENLYMSSNTKMSDSTAVKNAVADWFNERFKYSYNNPKFSMSTGHFTQLVWKNSKYLGIGIARSSKGVYVCASYDPSGNFRGQFARNVLKPRNSDL